MVPTSVRFCPPPDFNWCDVLPGRGQRQLDFAPGGEQHGKRRDKGLSLRRGEETRFASEVSLFRSPESMGDNGCRVLVVISSMDSRKTMGMGTVWFKAMNKGE